LIMGFDSTSLWSSKTKGGSPPYFYKNPPHVVYDFDQGTPAPELFPLDDLERITADILRTDGALALDYVDPAYGYTAMFLGWDPLREQIARYLSARESRTPKIEEIIVTNGSVQAVALAANTFLEPGDAVIVEGATFPFALRYFAQNGAKVFGAEVDGDGMVPDSVERKLREAKDQGLKPKMIYTIATGQLPTGTIMPLARRERVLELAREWNTMILEDAIYNPFQYEGEVQPTFWSLDTEGRVLQSDAFSKTIAPGTRLGWMLSSQTSTLGMATARQDLGSSMLLMRVLARYLEEGLLEPHLVKSRELYKVKRAAVESALREHCADYVSWRQPKAAFYCWLELSDAVDWDKVTKAMFDQGIVMRPGELFIGQETGPKHLRMAWGHLPVDELQAGIAKFGEVLKSSTV
jgi:2-aminoadipate transaminase